jgi:acyl-CoA thioesterase
MLEPKEIIDLMLEKDAFSSWAQMKVIHVSRGHSTLEMAVNHELINGFGIIHGGVVFSLADSALAFAANSKGRKAKTINANCNFIDAAFVGNILRAKAIEIKSGKNIGFFSVTVESEEKVVLTASFTVSYSSEEWMVDFEKDV